MPSDEGKIFEQVLAAFDAEDLPRARDLLTRLLKINPSDPRYWLYMSAAVETKRERVYCLKETLRLDPRNVAARRGLILFDAAPPDPNLAIPFDKQRVRWKIQRPEELKLQAMPRRPAWQFALMAIGFLVVVALILLGIFGPERMRVATLADRFLPGTLGPTPTYLPTSSPVVRTAMPTFIGPTPLWMLLPATYTPMPLYVNTPHPISEAYRTAIRSYQRGNYADMVTYLNQAATLQPDSPDILYYYGEAFRLQAQFENAATYYNRALAVDPNFAPAYLGKARAKMDQSASNWASAQGDLETAISLDANMYEARLELAAIAIQRSDPAAALQQLDIVAVQAPESVLLYFHRARAYLLKRDYPTALQDAMRANQMDITFLPAYRLVGEIYLAAGQPAAGIEALRTYTAYQTADDQALAWLGTAYAASGANDLAMAAFDAAIAVNPRSFDAYYQRGSMYLAQGSLVQAENDLEKAVGFDSHSFGVNAALGRTYLLAGKDGNAYQSLSVALVYAVTDYEKATVYYHRARALENLNQAANALKDWQALLALPAESIPQEWLTTARQRAGALATPTRTPITPSVTITPQPSRTPTVTRTPLPSATATASRTPTPTLTPTP